ncbi:hypothetical protein HNP84_002594 [Thermocatellispora tengchongensis]|uniref:Uncharacterized protein n=1 Tax=Thermocatellispora tengchongensis TaxID=1073253 RepID=A0A840P4P2_9ACTN|nr:hypothetical protein [Thermocatellispora tengchongensis]MBB5132873.1 hypothetical protein [Thermocatellispora tengchongensis]
MIASTGDQPALFVATPAPPPAESPVTGVAFLGADPAASDAAVIGDGYGWLADALPAPAAPTCPDCHRPAVLPAAAPVLWTCPHCHPTEV